MTDRIGALAALVNAHAPLAQPALERFHAMFRGEALVIDKWFALQAAPASSGGRVFARAKALTGHPDFSLRNPNRARSLLAMLFLTTRRRCTARMRPATCSGPTACARSTPSIRNSARAWRARSTAGAAWPSPTAAPHARRSRASPARTDLRTTPRDRHPRAAGPETTHNPMNP
jgi:hypothetical protein